MLTPPFVSTFIFRLTSKDVFFPYDSHKNLIPYNKSTEYAVTIKINWLSTQGGVGPRQDWFVGPL